MTENVENLILEHLKALRNDLRGFQAETGANFAEIKIRLSSLEERLALAERAIANTHGDNALVQSRLDRVDARIERIERRLELTAA